MQSVKQIKVGKHPTGIVGLDSVLEEMADTMQQASDQEVAAEMIQRLSKKNYIPSGAHKEYERAFIREYRKFIGKPVAEAPLEQVEIKVLGAGCPNCDKLERTLMALIEEMGVRADLEHVRDMKAIAAYGVMGSPALVINRKVRAAGSVPSKSKLQSLILEAEADLKKDKECRRNIVMKTFIRVMKALSDPNRVKIMKMLQHRPLCVCEIKEALGVAQSTASKHLRILEDAGLVRSFKDGLWVNYSLADGSGSPFAASMIGNLKHWLDDEAEINALNKILPGIDRHDIVGRE